jgi:hypothetical protein
MINERRLFVCVIENAVGLVAGGSRQWRRVVNRSNRVLKYHSARQLSIFSTASISRMAQREKRIGGARSLKACRRRAWRCGTNGA